jgi:hypothetical protein
VEASGELHTPAALPQGKEPPVPFDRRLGGPQSAMRKFLFLSRIEPCRLNRYLVTMLTELLGNQIKRTTIFYTHSKGCVSYDGPIVAKT